MVRHPSPGESSRNVAGGEVVDVDVVVDVVDARRCGAVVGVGSVAVVVVVATAFEGADTADVVATEPAGLLASLARTTDVDVLPHAALPATRAATATTPYNPLCLT